MTNGSDPLWTQHLAADALDLVHGRARPYLDALRDRPVQDVDGMATLADLGGELPEAGTGAADAVEELLRIGVATATHSTGPRFFHFVVGGSTPAAMAGDWVTSLLDQAGGLWTASPLASTAETVVLRWLKELFGLPSGHGGVLTPSATLANLTGLAAARWWWADRHGVDITATGFAGLPPMPVLSSGLVHPSVRKALQILGCGRDTVRVHAADGTGRLDLKALGDTLAAIDGPAVLTASAGDVNTGAFDPIDDLADLADRHGAWLHVDGAFGLFAALSPVSAHLTRGVERAHSVAADGHKWLNVPYDSGFVFVRDPEILTRAFGSWGAAYLMSGDDEHVDYNTRGPESSRRARALPIWATLRAYGRDGHREMVERHLRLARHLADRVNGAPDLELLAPAQLCVVCFRYRPPGLPPGRLDALNARLAAQVVADGRVYLGSTVYDGMTALRPAIVNWRTTEADVDLLVDIVRDIGARLLPAD
jgi:glutamate/tyrosine decarboxylase-like PLP-dependent enzyme